MIAREVKQTALGAGGLWIVDAVAFGGERAAQFFSGLKTLVAAGGQEVSTVSGALDAGPSGPVLLPVVSATWVAAQALAAGDDPAVALDRWCDDSVTLLDTVRQNRRRFIPVDLEQALANPADFLQALNQRCGLDLPTTGRAAPASASATEVLRNLVAGALVARHAQAQAMLPEVQAATLAFDAAQADVDLALAWKEFVVEAGASSGLARKIKTMGQVTDELYIKIHQQQLEIERQFLASRAAADKEQAARHDLRDSAKRITTLTADLEQARRDVDRAQFNTLASQEALNGKVAAQGERIAVLTAEVSRLQARAFVDRSKADDEIAALQSKVAELGEKLKLQTGGRLDDR